MLKYLFLRYLKLHLFLLCEKENLVPAVSMSYILILFFTLEKHLMKFIYIAW